MSKDVVLSHSSSLDEAPGTNELKEERFLLACSFSGLIHGLLAPKQHGGRARTEEGCSCQGAQEAERREELTGSRSGPTTPSLSKSPASESMRV